MSNQTNSATALSCFTFKTNEVRTVEKDGLIWFVASDIAKALNYADAAQMTRILDGDEKGMHTVQTLGGSQELLVVNESGMYHAVLKSRKPEAKPFRKWVTSEVLPTIRKTGSYSAPYTVNPGDTLTAEQADQLRDMLRAAVEGMPSQEAGKFMVKGWSKLKAHFGVGYRQIPCAQFTDALNIVSRHIAERVAELPRNDGTRHRFLFTMDGNDLRVQPIGQFEHVFNNEDIVQYVVDGIGKHLADIDFVAALSQACAARFKAEARKHLTVVK